MNKLVEIKISNGLDFLNTPIMITNNYYWFSLKHLPPMLSDTMYNKTYVQYKYSKQCKMKKTKDPFGASAFLNGAVRNVDRSEVIFCILNRRTNALKIVTPHLIFRGGFNPSNCNIPSLSINKNVNLWPNHGRIVTLYAETALSISEENLKLIYFTVLEV